VESLGEIVPILITASRAERATTRAAREIARRDAQSDAQSSRSRGGAADGLAVTRAELERMVTCHRAPYRKLDWRPLAARDPVAPPARTSEKEKAARRALATYEPSWQERMFGDEAQRRRQHTNRVFEAAREDEAAFQKARRAVEALNSETLLARRLMELDAKAIKEAIALKTRLIELREGMNGAALAHPGGGRVLAIVDAIQEGDVAWERIVELEPRGQRREPIPALERRQLHLAAMCAAGLRVGAELVSLLPVEAVEIAVGCEMPDPNGGRPAPQPVMQLLMTDNAVAGLDWRKGDAVTLATSLGARMDWSIEKGFAPIRLIPLTAMGRPLAKSA
jgi:hypothetical protein